jgi:hypothetical protein
MRFLIIGDSWGCGEWRKTFITAEQAPNASWSKSVNPNEWFINEVVPNTDIGHYLNKMGNRAVNLSKGGDSNINQLTRLKELLTVHNNYDYIVWIQTEPVRDYVLGNFKVDKEHYRNMLPEYDGYDRIVADWFRQTYDIAEEIYKQYYIPFVLVGGMCKISNIINQYSFAKHQLIDWANDMVFENPIPHPDNFGAYSSFTEEFIDVINHERFVKEANESLSWIEHSFSHKNFPDWAHPDRVCHQDLAAWISICSSIG